MTEPRDPTTSEVEILTALREAENVSLMPIVFNGQGRFGLVLVEENAAGKYVRLIAILPLATDVIADMSGTTPLPNPPTAPRQLN